LADLSQHCDYIAALRARQSDWPETAGRWGFKTLKLAELIGETLRRMVGLILWNKTMTFETSIYLRLMPVLCALLLTPHAAYATDSPATGNAAVERVEEVVLISPKNAAVMPYDSIYERLKRLQDSKIDRVALQIKVTTKDPKVKLSDVRVALVNDKLSIPIPIAPDGTVKLPLRADMYNTDAELRSNQPKGMIGGSISLGINWSIAAEIPYAEVEETVRQLQTAAKDVLGWLGYMLFFPSITNVDIPITYPEPKGQTLKIMKDGRAIKTFTADEKGVLTFRLDPRWKEWQPTFVFSDVPPKL